MKKVFVFVLVLSQLAFMVACAKTQEPKVTNEETTAEETTTEETTTEEVTEEETTQEPVEMDKVTFILDWLPNTNHTGIYSAIEKGYFADENIEVEVIQPAEGDATALVATGQGEFGVSFQETVSLARTAENPIPVVAIAAIIQNNTSGFASLKDKNIESPKDFEDKIYGSWGTEIETAFIKTMMEKENADFDSLDVIDIVSYDFLTSISNDVDFQWIYYGWDGIAAEKNGMDLNFIKLQDIDERLNFYTPVIITSEDLIEENPELIKRFMNATSKGYEYAVENPEEAVKDLLKYAPETDEEIAIASQKYLANEFIADSDAWGYMKESIWTNFSTWMFENGVINQELDVEKAYTNEFLPEKN